MHISVIMVIIHKIFFLELNWGNKMNSKIKKWLKRIVIGLTSVFLLLVIGLFIYSSGSYEALAEMSDQIALIDDTEVTIEESYNSIKYTVEDPLKNIIFVPGGLVEPDSYSYLALSLAVEGYNVTIIKALFNLAIITPNQAARFIDDSLDNVIIGHSLGGVVASMVASKNDEITQIVMMGSYPIKDVTAKKALLITAEFDLGMDQAEFDEHLKFVTEETVNHYIEGGNHAQFGWYGSQKGDGDATISTLTQQNLVIQYILDFIA